MRTLKLAAIGALIIASYNCKDVKKENKEEVKEVKTEMYSLVQDSTKVSFTAYKTSEKKPVGGQFTKININESNTGPTALEALNGTSFSIPVSSLFTNDATGTRDPKIIEFFFNVMKNTSLITGIFKVEGNDKCSIAITLNGVTTEVPLSFKTTSENRYTFNGTIQLEEFDALGAVASINKACEALHTGPDGVSKTWSDVAIQAEVLLQKQ